MTIDTTPMTEVKNNRSQPFFLKLFSGWIAIAVNTTIETMNINATIDDITHQLE